MMALLHMFSPLWPLAPRPIGARLTINVFWTGSGIRLNHWKVDQATLVIYMWLQSHICGGGATVSDITRSGPDRQSREWSRAHARIFTALFLLNIVVVEDVDIRDLEGVPLGARMRNRVSRLFFVVFCSEMTWSWSGSLGCAQAQQEAKEVPVLFSGIFGYL